MEPFPLGPAANQLWILASSSPRRRELLSRLGHPFRVIEPAIAESPRPGERPADFARRAATEKAAAAARLPPQRGGAPRTIIGCDTVVALADRIFGKPRTAAEARRMLRALSGRRHRVISGLCVLRERASGSWRRQTRTVSTEVIFRRLFPGEIVAYVATGEPMDKAGAYAIQGGAAAMVVAIHGSYTNVVGLPLAELVEMLRQQGPSGSLVKIDRP
jgi:septum formation protein